MGVLAASTTLQLSASVLHAWTAQSCLLLTVLWAKPCQGPAKPHSHGAVHEHPGVLLSSSIGSCTDAKCPLASRGGSCIQSFLLSADLSLPAWSAP